MERVIRTDYEKQRELFGEFIEDARDIFELKISDGVKTTFTDNSIIFDDIVEIITSPKHLLPNLQFHRILKTPTEISICRNVINNLSEITQIFREYILLKSHLDNFTDLGTSSNVLYATLVQEIEYLQTLETGYFDGHKFFIKKDSDYQYFLHVIKYGNAKKQFVDMEYIVKDIKTNESKNCFRYQINKAEFPGDVAYQLSEQKCSHIK